MSAQTASNPWEIGSCCTEHEYKRYENTALYVIVIETNYKQFEIKAYGEYVVPNFRVELGLKQL